MYYIYAITNIINNKKYIGFSCNYKERWKTHISAYYSKAPTKKVLYLSMRKHGIENFIFELIYCSKDKDHTKNIMEAFFIKEYGSRHPNGYNITRGGDGGPGVTSQQAIDFNKRRIEDGSHIFLNKEFQKTIKSRMIKNNPMKNPETKAKQIKAASISQRKKVAEGNHYFQSEASKQEKIKRMNIMKARPLIKEVRELFKKANEKVPRSLHSTSDSKLLDYKYILEQEIARLQISSFDLFSVF